MVPENSFILVLLFLYRNRDREREKDRVDRRREKERKRSRSPKKRDDGKRIKEEVGGGAQKRTSIEPKTSNRTKVHESGQKRTSIGSKKYPELTKEPTFDPTAVDKEEEQNRLEAEMQKRRERIERWRAERKRKELEMGKKDRVMLNITVQGKKWSLEDDEEDDDVVEIKMDEVDDDDFREPPKKEEDDVDPLDAYMKNVQDEVRKINKFEKPKSKGGLTIVSGVAKKNTEKKKGELIEQNQDGLEYSSEEEMEDIKDTAANLANKQKKELAKIDHTSVEYASFRKDFYVEVPEIAKLTQEEIDKYRSDLEGIQVKGKGCPKPIKTWAHCGVSKKELEVLKKQSFETPTPIQCQAIPAIMSGRDLIGIAKTGSGKTLAFILPMFRHILDQPELEDGEGPISIILAPTRELCMQIGKDIKKFSKSLNLRAVCVYGGTGISEQIAELKRGAEIIVCTPGRMIDMLAANSGRVTNLRRVTYVVLDEADRMFDMGFEPQVMRIIDNVRPDRQTVMFSATFPRQMEALARRILKKPIEIIVGGRSIVCKEIEQNIAVLEDDAKFFKLLELLGQYQEHGSIIVFVDKQENADILLKDLMKASYPCLSLHGGIDQYDRDSTILDFKSGKCKLLIATSVAARGLDVKQIVLVVNYDCPNHYEDYVHRVGRTGRAGRKGFAWTFLTHEQGRYSGRQKSVFNCP